MGINTKNSDITAIFIYKTTRERIKNIGKKGETYDTILNRVLNKVEHKRPS